MASIGILLIALILIIVTMLSTREQRDARQSRAAAVKTLLSRNPDGKESESQNLYLITGLLYKPIKNGGSLDNLNHFLSKDPGRRDFGIAGDRRRLSDYLNGEIGILAEQYSVEFKNSNTDKGMPEWAPDYIGTVRALFDNVRDDLMIISGIPGALTDLPLPDSDETSITQKTEIAVGQFASRWIPSGETKNTYELDRQKIRGYLLGNKRFLKRMEGLDNGWKELTASLYKLSINPRWMTAVGYYPDLRGELNELTILIIAADVYRRNSDLMVLINNPDMGFGNPVSPGILWLPEFSYYKNIPELTGQLRATNNDVTIFFAKVNLGYTFRDGRTQTWLNRRKDWLTDYFNLFFSVRPLDDFSPLENSDITFNEWKSARLKAQGIHGINKKIAAVMPFGVKGVYGVRDLALVKVNLLTNP